MARGGVDLRHEEHMIQSFYSEKHMGTRIRASTGGGGTLGRDETPVLLEKRAREVLALGSHP